MTEYYDYLLDFKNPSLPIDLKQQTSTSIRGYQAACLSKMFGSGRARSGVIVLPCGAGKTLVGIVATATIKKSTLIVCINNLSVTQWYAQFRLWTTIPARNLLQLTSKKRDLLLPNEACVLFTTYAMISMPRNRSEKSQEIMDMIKQREWGLLLLDEVHVGAADSFRKVTTETKSHCKIGLTATLLREDEKVDDLLFLVGPKLYEANWTDLQDLGYLANVKCAEIICDMTPEFFLAYLNETDAQRQMRYACMNPNKFRACEFLVRYHEMRGDKIIVFSDDIPAIATYANLLKRPFIHGKSSDHERLAVISQFRFNPALKTIFTSRIGDAAIDIPEANVIIQISSQQGSRRQEAQRLGRIMRPKGDEKTGFNAFFYTLVTKDTKEIAYSIKRQQYLLDQGFSFKFVANLCEKFCNWGSGPMVTLTEQNEKDMLITARTYQKDKVETCEDDDGEAPISSLGILFPPKRKRTPNLLNKLKKVIKRR